MTNNSILIVVVVFVLIVAFTVAPKEYYSSKHPIIDEIKRRFGVISPKYAKIPIKIGNKSYTEDKSVITLCITNPDTKQLYSINVLMYVALHELSHCLTKADGKESHGTEFKNNFAKLLKEAADKGVYNAAEPIPVAYCGTEPEKGH
jgi:hypothetical protein